VTFLHRRVKDRSGGAVTCNVIMKGDKRITFFVRVRTKLSIRAKLNDLIRQQMVPNNIAFLGPYHFSKPCKDKEMHLDVALTDLVPPRSSACTLQQRRELSPSCQPLSLLRK
jgi:hypothetical protein